MDTFDGETADFAWRKAADRFKGAHGASDQSSRAGQTSELLHAAFVIRNPAQRWVVSRRPAISVAFAIVEAIGILSGRHDARFFNYWNPSLPKYAGHVDTYPGAYGFRLRHHFGFDQLERAYLALKNKQHSRQVVLQIWDSAVDMPTPEGHPTSEDIPCNICSMLKIRDDKLEWTQIIRSNDLFRGVPYNFVQFTSLQEVVAGWLGVKVGSYTQVADSLHVYQRDLKAVLDYASAEPILNTDSLCLAKSAFDVVLNCMVEHINDLAGPDLTQEDVRSIFQEEQLPLGYRNLLAVVAAEGARRRGWPDLASEAMVVCTNPILKELWKNWITRNRRGTPVII